MNLKPKMNEINTSVISNGNRKKLKPQYPKYTEKAENKKSRFGPIDTYRMNIKFVTVRCLCPTYRSKTNTFKLSALTSSQHN